MQPVPSRAPARAVPCCCRSCPDSEVNLDQHSARCGDPAPEGATATLSAAAVLVREMLVDKRMHRCDQARDFPPHHRQGGRGVAIGSDLRHEIKVIVETLPQLGEQDQVAHGPLLPRLAGPEGWFRRRLRPISYDAGQGQSYCGAEREKPLFRGVDVLAVQCRRDDHCRCGQDRGLRQRQVHDNGNRHVHHPPSCVRMHIGECSFTARCFFQESGTRRTSNRASSARNRRRACAFCGHITLDLQEHASTTVRWR